MYRNTNIQKTLFKQNGHNVGIVKKKDVAHSLCIDYWQFNQIYFVLNNAKIISFALRMHWVRSIFRFDEVTMPVRYS